ncbi:MAG: lipoprotein [Marinobacter excellens HL-55]|uniref:Lipoprotein n=1 Tax=Marinobacter excellens HL-55 TaxID=1305731 RepID=A0A0P7YJC7_9GAMM|nr:MAG: lipoprotein [Marinobacter excellens HL-55]
MNILLFRRRSLLATLVLMLLTFGGGQVSAQTMQEPPPESDMRVNTDDPYENWNRKVFSFNDAIDRWFLRPVAQAYRTVTPDIVDRGVTNFFNNLTEIRNFSNSVLQLKGESAVVAVGRFTYNTVFGLGGIFDVATAFDLPERPEDFGQTLGYWGVGSGPYLMLPLLGPATPRYFSGMVTDGFLLPSAWDEVSSPETYYLRVLQIVDRRADFIPAEQFISGDRYTFVRNAFLQRREFLIKDGKITEDPFADDDDFMLEDF